MYYGCRKYAPQGKKWDGLFENSAELLKGPGPLNLDGNHRVIVGAASVSQASMVSIVVGLRATEKYKRTFPEEFACYRWATGIMAGFVRNTQPIAER